MRWKECHVVMNGSVRAPGSGRRVDDRALRGVRHLPENRLQDHPFIGGVDAVQRYFSVMAECALASKLRLAAKKSAARALSRRRRVTLRTAQRF